MGIATLRVVEKKDNKRLLTESEVIIIIKTSLYTVANQLIYLQGFVAFH